MDQDLTHATQSGRLHRLEELVLRDNFCYTHVDVKQYPTCQRVLGVDVDDHPLSAGIDYL